MSRNGLEYLLQDASLSRLSPDVTCRQNQYFKSWSLRELPELLEDTESDLYDGNGDARVPSASRKVGWIVSGMTSQLRL